MPKPLRIDIISDTVCPWCYVGKRHLDMALARRPDLAVDCHWQPFQLNPDMPLEGVDRKIHWRNKFGGESRIADIVQRLVEVGKPLNIAFDFDAIEIQPNTIKSHVMLHELDGDWPHQNQLKEEILKAFFVDGRDIGDDDTLVELAVQCGLPEATARIAISDPVRLQQARQMDQGARQMGVTGVPTFVFNRTSALTGAQPPDAIVAALDQLQAQSQTP